MIPQFRDHMIPQSQGHMIPYWRQFSETDYVLSTSHTVNLGGKAVRAVCIGLEKAKEAGIDLEGFGIA